MNENDPRRSGRLRVASLLLAGFLILLGGVAASATETAGLKAVQEVIDLVLEKYRNRVSYDDLVNGAIRGVLETLDDPYSYYMDPEESERFNEHINSAFGGLGISIESRGGYITVVTVIPMTPAARAGLQPGDRVLVADGEDLRDASLEVAVNILRGEPGTNVNLIIERGREKLRLTLTRAIIEIPSLDTRFIDNRYGYIKISQFSNGTGGQFNFVYGRYASMRADGIIVDLRDNPGGLLSEAVVIAETLVPRGALVHIVDRNGNKSTISGRSHASGPPVVVLVNRGSASASEIVAGAVQDHGVGILVGTRTYGKASVQTLYPLPSEGAVKITTARYLTPNGRIIDGVGLQPDVEVPEADPNYQAPAFADLGVRPLRRGLVGLDVLGMQQRLKYLGYPAGPEDGIAGAGTLSALRLFQADRGVKEVSGVPAGTATYHALQQAFMEAVADRRQAADDLVLQRAIEILRDQAAYNAALGAEAG